MDSPQVSVALRSETVAQLMVHEDVASLWQTHRDADVIFIDMPVGLLECGPGERPCEYQARRMLGFRRPSVFPVPSRQAVYAESDAEAMVANRECADISLVLPPKSDEVRSLRDGMGNPGSLTVSSPGH